MSGERARREGILRHAWWRTLDYGAVAWWQVVALLSRTPPDAFVRQGAAHTVVLLPGVYEPWRLLLPWARLLHDEGASVHVLPGLGFNRGPIPAAAAALAEHLDRHDLRGVTLVAHSKGGLIGKLAMTALDPDGRIAGLVAVSSPFDGSRYARWVPVRTVRAFAPTDATIVALAADVAVNARITSAYAFWDPHIPEGSSLAGAREIVLDTPGHFRPMADPELLALLRDRVR